MNVADETITIINRKYNSSTGYDEWKPTVITGASWYSKMVASVTVNGLKAADTATVRIPLAAVPAGTSYMTPQAYKAAVSVSGAFTLANGDLIVRGAVTEGRDPLTPKAVQETYADCFTIISVGDNTRRAHEPHWKVVAT